MQNKYGLVLWPTSSTAKQTRSVNVVSPLLVLLSMQGGWVLVTLA